MMNINFNSFSRSATFFFREYVTLSLTAQQKKILVIASLALSCLALCYVISRCCFKDKVVVDEKKIEQKSKKIPLTPFISQLKTDIKPMGRSESSPDSLVPLDSENSVLYPRNSEKKHSISPLISTADLSHSLESKNEKIELVVSSENDGIDPQKESKLDQIIFDEKEPSENEVIDPQKESKFDQTIFDEKEPAEVEGARISSEEIVEVGKFKNDLLIKGKKTFPPGHRLTVEEGEFNEKGLQGTGKRIYSDGDIYEGEFKDDELEKGIKNFKNASITEGKFKNGFLNGLGKKIFSSGEANQAQSYEGEFQEGWLIEGTIILFDGTRESGTFSYSYLTGPGKKIFPDGRVEEGEYRNGKLITVEEQQS